MLNRSSVKKTGTALALAGVLSVAACQSIQDNPKQTAGTIIGAAGGGLLGSQIGGGTGKLAATAAGTLLGAYLGSEIGKSLDRADRQAMAAAQQQAHASPIGDTISWNNPNSGHSGTITPVRDGRASSGEYCREYRTTVTIDGRREQAYGTACQQPDGTWRIVD